MAETPLSAPKRQVSAEALRRVCASVFARSGLADSDAALVADSLVQADLWGHQSHGTLRLPWYVARLRSGAVDAKARPALVRDSGAIAVIDGGDAMGQLVAGCAMDEAVRRAKAHGVGAVAVRNSNHFGTAMYFTLAAARAGCIGFLSTNASPAMPPWGGRAKAVGTNPWSWAAPAGKYPPMVLDIANTGVARGKIYLARQNAKPIPLGWALDKDGAPTTDPVAALAGVTLPMAEHKGYGIALMMDVLSGMLSGGGFGASVQGPYQAERPGKVGHFALALDVEAFTPLRDFEDLQEQLIGQLKLAPLAEGFDEILYPGEPEARRAKAQADDGLVLPPETMSGIVTLCEELGIETPALA
jgi:LDH2 family malate/lactate/ureidoglycolate dehydrogenase